MYVSKTSVWNSSRLMEWRAVIGFFPLKKSSAKDIRAELKGVYGHEALSLSAMKKSCKRFAKGRINLKDDPRSGRPAQSDLRESVRALTEESPFLTCNRM
jgi:hypothetical protein